MSAPAFAAPQTGDLVCFTCEQPICSCTDAQWAAGRVEERDFHSSSIADQKEAIRGE